MISHNNSAAQAYSRITSANLTQAQTLHFDSEFFRLYRTMSRSQLARALELSKKDVPKHPFPLKLIESCEVWQCDGCEEEQLLTSERYTCSKKDFDYCRKCVENSGTTVVGGLKTNEDIVEGGVVAQGKKKKEGCDGRS